MTHLLLRRRQMLKASATGAGVLALSGAGLASIPEIARALNISQAEAASVYIEAFPTSPVILSPFTDPLPIPKALAPASEADYHDWKDPVTGKLAVPGPDNGKQDCDGGTHQTWTDKLGLPEPIYYKIRVELGEHRFTSSQVLPINADGLPTTSYDAARKSYAPGTARVLPKSMIYGFNGTFPGARINAEYGKPVCVRFENHLDENPFGSSRADFGAPDWGFLTHLHNGHTASESDGNPNYRSHQNNRSSEAGYLPGGWVDNLYLNYPAGGDDREKQSFFWFHDHYHNHTSANVYKGMVGLYPIYDPKLDMGDETNPYGLRLPGRRTNNPDGSFDVEYDIPLALYDMRLDDGVTPHKDFHGGNGETHREWWGQSFFKHFPNHGFVGDIFTINGTAYPVLEVKRRKYRLRFLDASISRIYDLQLMSSRGGPKSAMSLGYKGDDLQGQYRLPDGQQCMRFTQIANDGGLLPKPIVRNNFELWPAKRREVVVDFSKYQDGSPTKKGDVIYLVNVMKMQDGRMWDSPDPAYKVPMMKIVIGDDAPDASQIPSLLREQPTIPQGAALQQLLNKRRVFKLERGGSTGGIAENEWSINGQAFDATKSLAKVKRGTWEAWEIQNGGGGWVHPMHIHQEEHHTISRNGKAAPDSRHPDDTGKEDVVALDPGESVVFVRQFRTFTGKYVAHCHNLAHEDHSMMFGWEIVE
jgi:FtsP/CotA-like multicopper oxidase with cupredoxin domain